MTNVIYASIASERDDRFKICTKIVDSGNTYIVRKEALDDSGKEHIQDIIKNETVLQGTYFNTELFKILPVLNKGEDWVEFAYQDKNSLEKYLCNLDEDSILKEMNRFWNVLLKCEMCDEPDLEEYKKVFGESLVYKNSLHWSKGQDVDLLFSNLYLKDGKYIVTDYEWVFPFAVPLEFVYFRGIMYSHMSCNKQVLYEVAGIKEEDIEGFKKTEASFQQYVKGDSVSLWEQFDRFAVGHENWNIIDLKEKERQERREIESLNNNIKEVNKKLQIKENEITNKNTQLENKNSLIAEKDEQIRQLQYLERELKEIKNSFFVKAMYKWYKIRDFVLPKGSRRRLFVKVMANLVKHPVKMIKTISFSRIGKFFVLLFKGDVYRISEKVEDVTLSDFDRMKLNIESGSDRTKLRFAYCEDPVVSIVLPVYNQFDYTYLCLKSILKHCKKYPYEIIVGDDCSDDEIKDLKKYAENIRIIRNEKNLGFIRNCNHAAKYAKGKYIVFLNNDTQVQEKWLESLVELIESDETIGMVGSKLVYPDGTLQEAGGIIWRDGSGWNYGRNKSPLDSEYNYVKDVDYISGASIMVGKELWEKIGGFDERYCPAYFEDSDLAFAIRKKGYRVVYQPLSVLVHFEGVSNGTDENSGLKHYQVVNKEKFVEKWKNELEQQYASEVDVFKARDRSKDKKTIVVIDHYVPQYDKDAGSKTTVQYLKMFVKKGFNVKFVPDNFYYDETNVKMLQQMGIEVLYGEKYAKHIFDWIIQNEKHIDYVYLNRPHISIKYIDFIKDKTDIRIMYYGHDLHFLRTEREYELNKDPQTREEARKWKEQEFHILRKADMNYYPSSVEVGEIKSIDNSIMVKAIVPYIFGEHRKNNFDSNKREGILFVGGFTHKPNLDAVNWFLNEIYPKLDAQIKPFYIVGSNPPQDLLDLNMDNVIVKGYVSEQELQRLYDSCRLVVAPLRYGAGIKGKIIEAMYNGVPIVTTSVGAEGIQECEKILFINDDADEMATTINELYDNAKLLKMRSLSEQDYIKKNYSLENAWEIVKDDFI